MLGGDLGLPQVGAGRGAEVLDGELGCGEQPGALMDRIGVVERAVLVVEEDEVAGGVKARGRTRVLEQLEGQQGQDLGVLRSGCRRAQLC